MQKYSEMELRGAVDFLRSVACHVSRGSHALELSRDSRCPRCMALGEVAYVRSLVELDLAFFELESR